MAETEAEVDVTSRGEAAGVGRSPEEQSSGKEGDFNTAAVLTVSAAHAVNDTYSFMLPPLLPLLIPKLGIPLVAAGALATVIKGSSLVQPFFGVWADRVDARYFVILAPTVTALGMSLLGLAPTYEAVLLLLLISGTGAAAFHPAAAAAVTYASGSSWGRGTSYYMVGSEFGRALGPMLIVSIVTWFGLGASYLAALPAVFLSILLYVQFRRGTIPKRRTGNSTASIWSTVKAQKRALLLLAGVVFFRSVSVTSFTTFYPTHITSLGASLAFAGLAVTVYEIAGAGGALMAGAFSDRFGRRTSLVISQLLTGPVLWVALVSWDGPVGLLFMAMAGALAMSAMPVQLTLGQELMPGSRSTAASIVFFLGFEGTFVATIVVGAIGDQIGLGNALNFSVLVSMLSIPFTLALPEPQRTK